MSQTYPFLVIAAIMVLTAVQPHMLQAGNLRELRVEVVNGVSRTTIKDSLKGDQTIDYKIGTGAGQHMIAVFETDNPRSHFDLMAPGQTEVPFFSGAEDGNRFEGDLPEGGSYTIRVYLMDDAALQNETAQYTITVYMTPIGTTP